MKIKAVIAKVLGVIPPRDCTLDPRDDEDGVQVTSGLNAIGQELPDPVPTAPPIGYEHGPSLHDTIMHFLHHHELRKQAAEEGFDSFEEGDDFDIDDDPNDPQTPWEHDFEPGRPPLPANELSPGAAERLQAMGWKPPPTGSPLPSQGEGGPEAPKVPPGKDQGPKPGAAPGPQGTT